MPVWTFACPAHAPKKAPPVGEAGPVTWGAERRGPPPTTPALPVGGARSPCRPQKILDVSFQQGGEQNSLSRLRLHRPVPQRPCSPKSCRTAVRSRHFKNVDDEESASAAVGLDRLSRKVAHPISVNLEP